jgi:hypothetical protein
MTTCNNALLYFGATLILAVEGLDVISRLFRIHFFNQYRRNCR